VIDADGRPTEHFGQPTWVYLKYARRKGDTRPEREILAEGRQRIAEVRARGVFIAEGHGDHPWDLEPTLDSRLRWLYQDSKKSIWAELPAEFESCWPSTLCLSSQSTNREDYILHPPTGEALSVESLGQLRELAHTRGAAPKPYDVQIVISDGLNSFAITDEGHVGPFIDAVRGRLAEAGFRPAPELLVVRGGRVRAGYRIGEVLFGDSVDPREKRAILHVIGERPGSGHHAFSVYITAPGSGTWAQKGLADHNMTRVVSGIADTALDPKIAARETVSILAGLTRV